MPSMLLRPTQPPPVLAEPQRSVGLASPSTRRSSRRKRGDVLLVFAVAVLVYVVARRYGWFHWAADWLRTGHRHGLGEALLAFAFLCMGLSLVACQRWCEGTLEIQRRRRLQGELEALHAQLNERVEARTRELVEANAALQAEATRRMQAQEAAARSEVRYRHLFETSPMPMWVYDLRTLRFLAVNQAAIVHYGYSADEFKRMTLRDIRPEEDVEALEQSVARNTGDIDFSGIWRHRKSNGVVIQVEITSHVVEFEGVQAKLVLANDVTTRVQQELRIRRLNRVREMIGDVTSAMLRIDDAATLLEEACRIASSVGLYPLACVVRFSASMDSLDIAAFRGDDMADLAFIRHAFEQIPRSHIASYLIHPVPVAINILGDDSHFVAMRERLFARGLMACGAFPLVVGGQTDAVMILFARERNAFDDDELALLNWMSGDIAYALDHIEKSRRLEHLASYDELTGLPNERAFREQLDNLVGAACRNATGVAVIAGDLEHFTRVNETFGRAVGDELLRGVARRFKENAGDKAVLARIAADTFVVALPFAAEDDVSVLRDALFAALSRPFRIGEDAIRVSAKLGIAAFPLDGNDTDAVFKNAENALKQAELSRDRFAYYSSARQAEMASKLAMEDELRTAIEEKQFDLEYQARIDVINGDVIGAEALLRWRHPKRGLLGPNEFIPVAEETGLIVPIGRWALDRVCEQQAAWIAAGLQTVPIAVNVSAIQLADGCFLRGVQGALERCQLPPKYLELEITETAIMEDIDVSKASLATLHRHGIRLALDDFGIGYSSLAQLKHLPFDTLKLDKTFVDNIAANPDDAAIAKTVFALAHQLGMKVVAEGVESQGQFNFLRRHGCDSMQGYHFSRPLPKEEFERQLVSGRRLSIPEQPSTERKTVLLVDDEPNVLAALARTFRREGYRILSAQSGTEALDLLSTNSVQVIVSDQRMPDMSGTEFLSVVKKLYPETTRIILSGYTDLAAVTDAVNRGAVYKFLTKPWEDDELREQIRSAFRSKVAGPRAASALHA